jgi:hypothetical protein
MLRHYFLCNRGAGCERKNATPRASLRLAHYGKAPRLDSRILRLRVKTDNNFGNSHGSHACRFPDVTRVTPIRHGFIRCRLYIYEA